MNGHGLAYQDRATDTKADNKADIKEAHDHVLAD